MHPIVICALLWAFFLFSGIIKIENKHPYTSLLACENVNSINAIVQSSPAKLSSGTYYNMELSLCSVTGAIGQYLTKADATGRIRAFVPSEIVESYFPGKLYKSPAFFDIGESVTLQGSFSCKDGENVFFADSAKTYGYIKSKNIFNNVRAAIRHNLRKILFSWHEAGGFLLALLTGCREYVPINCSSLFQRSGVTHILAISGMHLTFISGITSFLVCKILGKRHKLLILFLSELIFVYIAGLSPSIFRAFFCSVFALLCAYCYMEKSEYKIEFLALVFLLHTVFLPSQIKSVSFMLTYAAYFGISLLCDKVSIRLSKIMPPFIAKSIALSFSAQIATSPVLLILFSTFMPFALVASIIISPFVSLFIVIGFAFLIVSLLFPFSVHIFAVIMNSLYRIIFVLLGLFASLPVIELGEK